MFKAFLTMLLCFAAANLSFGQGVKPLLLRSPSLSQKQIAFSYAGDIWVVSREGGEARRLTAGVGSEAGPFFSPDGSLIAFTGEYDGNTDVYIISASGGVPIRLTYHPGPDVVVGWTPDGKQVVFWSMRKAHANGVIQLFMIPVGGGFPTEIPLPTATEGSFSSDGSRLAYVPRLQWQNAWKRYRGGQTKPIWIVNLSDSSIEEKIPRDNSNDFNPMWIGDKVYFLSDRNGPVTLFAYDTKSKKVEQLIKNDGLDIKSASADSTAIVYEQFGTLHLLDLNSHGDQKLDIRVVGDLTEIRPHFQKIEPKRIQSAAISPGGARALFAVRGEVLSVPAEKGDIRNITRTTSVVERDPAWSPDGKSIAYLSDASGEYALHVRDQNGLGEVRKFDLGNPPTFYYSPTWSPDSKKIAYTDKRLNLWFIDLEKKTPVRVDTDTYAASSLLNPNWSPDSRWLAYTKQLSSHLHAVFVYSLEQGKGFQVTDGISDALYADFDKEGKYLYFTASTDVALSTGSTGHCSRPLIRMLSTGRY